MEIHQVQKSTSTKIAGRPISIIYVKQTHQLKNVYSITKNKRNLIPHLDLEVPKYPMCISRKLPCIGVF